MQIDVDLRSVDPDTIKVFFDEKDVTRDLIITAEHITGSITLEKGKLHRQLRVEANDRSGNRKSNEVLFLQLPLPTPLRLERNLVSSDERPDNGTSFGDFVPGFEGHLRPIEIAIARNRDDLLPLNHHFKNHFVGIDIATHAATVRTVDFESKGRGGLNFKLERIYSAFEHYRRKNLETLARYLHPYYAQWSDIVNDPDYFDSAFRNLFQRYLESAKAQQELWWSIIWPSGSVCPEPVGCFDPAGFTGCYSYLDAYNQLQSEPCYIDQFGQSMMHDESIEALVSRMERIIAAMELDNYDYSITCYDPGTFEVVGEGTPGSVCDNSMVFLKNALMYENEMLKNYTTRIQSDFRSLEQATADFVNAPEWWNGNLGPGWTFNLHFIELPGQIYQSPYDRPGAVYFDGYRRRVFDAEEKRYKEFPEEGAIYWNLSAFRSYQNTGALDAYAPCDWIGNPFEVEPTCSPVPGITFAPGIPRIGGQLRYEIEHLIMIRDLLYWFNSEGQLCFISNHNLKNFIEIAWQSIPGGSEEEAESNCIDYIRDSAGNICSFSYIHDTLFGETMWRIHKIENEITEKTIEYEYQRQVNSNEWVLKAAEVRDESSGDSYEMSYRYDDIAVITQEMFDGTHAVNFQSLLTKEINPLGGEAEFKYHDSEYSEFMAVNVAYVFRSGETFFSEAFRVRTIPRVKKFTRLYQKKVVSETLCPRTVVNEEGIGIRKTNLTEIEWDRATERTFATKNGRSHLKRTILAALICPDTKWSPFVGQWEVIIRTPDGHHMPALLKVKAAIEVQGGGTDSIRLEAQLSSGDMRIHSSSLEVFGKSMKMKFDVDFLGSPGTIKMQLEVEQPDQLIGSGSSPQGHFVVRGRRVSKSGIGILRWFLLSSNLDNYSIFIGDKLEERSYKYTGEGNIRKVSTRKGDGFSFNEGWTFTENTYTGNGLRISVFGLPDKVVFGDGVRIHREVEYEYDDKYPWLVTLITGDVIKTSIVYDIEHRKPETVTQIDPETEKEITVTYMYDEFGNRVLTSGPLDRVRTETYHDVNSLPKVFLEKVTLHGVEEQIIEEFFHGPTGERIYYKDPRGFETYYQYDAFGRLKQTESSTDIVLFSYETTNDGALQFDKTVVKHALVNGDDPEPEFEDILTLKSDKFNRAESWTVKRRDREATFGMVYDRRDRLYQTLREDTILNEFLYDGLDRIIRYVDSRGGSWVISYDDRLIDRRGKLTCKEGWVSEQPLSRVSVTNPVGMSVLYYRDGRDRLAIKEKWVEDENLNLKKVCWRYGWNNRDLFLFERSPLGIVRYNIYDRFHRLTEKHVFQISTSIDPRPVPPYCDAANLDCSKEIWSYRDDHRVKTHTDANGKTTSYGYDRLGRLDHVTPPVGVSRYLTYDQSANILQITEGPKTRKFTYDSRGFLRTFCDCEENLTVYDHNFYGELVRETRGLNCNEIDPEQLPDPLQGGYTKKWEYGIDGLEEYRDEEDSIYTWTYDRNGGLERTTEPRGNIATRQYRTNGAGDIIEVTDSEENRTVYERDSLGRVIGMIAGSLGRRYRLLYNAHGKIGALVEYPDTPGEATWRNVHDFEGRLVAVISPEGKRKNYCYDVLGRVKTESVGNPDHPFEEWKYSYDKVGNLRFVTNPLGATTEYLYDSVNRIKGRHLPYQKLEKIKRQPGDQLITRYDQNGNTEIFELDGNGMITKHIDQEGYIAEFEYTRRLLLKRLKIYNVSNPDKSYAEEYAYYPTGLLDYVKYATGHTRDFEYDPNGNLVKVTDPMGLVTTYQYEKPYNYATLITTPFGLSAQIERDEDGRILKIISNPGGTNSRVMRFEYDDAKRLVVLYPPGWDESEAGSGILKYRYDRDWGLKSIEYPTGAMKEFIGYDDKGRLLAVKNANNQVFRYHYNGLGQLEFFTVDGQNTGEVTRYRADGKVTTLTGLGSPRRFKYRGTDGLLDKLEIDGRIHLSRNYYDNGRSLTLGFVDGTRKKIGYNAWGLPETISEVDSWSGNSKEIRYEFDALGRIKMELTDGRSNKTEYYPNGLLKRINDVFYRRDPQTGKVSHIEKPGHPTIEFGYNEFGQLDFKMTRAGFKESYRYYQSGKIKEIVNNSGVIAIKYDQNGHPDRVSIDLGSYTDDIDYDYDSAGQLWRVKSTYYGSIEYKYDPANNLTEIKDLITGNVIQKRGFDSFNHLENYQTFGPNSVSASLSYDSMGNLLAEKRSDGLNKKFDHDGVGRLRSVSSSEDFLIRELDYDAIDRLVEDSSFLLEHISYYPISITTESAKMGVVPDPETGRSLALMGESRTYIPTWLLGSVIHLSLDDGSSLGSLAREPYGFLLGGAADQMPFSFKGYCQHTGSNLYWAHARHYDAELKFFLSPDALPGCVAYPESLNRYGSFGGDPVGAIDFFGLYCPPPAGEYEAVVCAKRPPPRKGPRDIPPGGRTRSTSMTSEERERRARKRAREAIEKVNQGLQETERRSEDWKRQMEGVNLEAQSVHYWPETEVPELPYKLGPIPEYAKAWDPTHEFEEHVLQPLTPEEFAEEAKAARDPIEEFYKSDYPELFWDSALSDVFVPLFLNWLKTAIQGAAGGATSAGFGIAAESALAGTAANQSQSILLSSTFLVETAGGFWAGVAAESSVMGFESTLALIDNDLSYQPAIVERLRLSALEGATTGGSVSLLPPALGRAWQGRTPFAGYKYGGLILTEVSPPSNLPPALDVNIRLTLSR